MYIQLCREEGELKLHHLGTQSFAVQIWRLLESTNAVSDLFPDCSTNSWRSPQNTSTTYPGRSQAHEHMIWLYLA